MEDIEQIVNGTAPFCDEDTHPRLRLLFISVGTVIAVVGCVSNALLVIVFCRSKWNPFQTFLAVLDFLLCSLFIACFGALSFATTLRIEWLYLFLKRYSVHLLILSRIVQLCIPYILIAITADRLTAMSATPSTRSGCATRILALIFITVAVVLLRIPGFFVMEVVDLPDCDLFTSKALSSVELSDEDAKLYQNFDLVVQFFHLFVSFVILSVLNMFVIHRLHRSHQRRQSSCSAALHSIRSMPDPEVRTEQKRLRYAIRTTIVIISSYLACNSVNFVLYAIEMFNSDLTKDESANNFNVFYVVASDMGTNLFVFSSSIRLYIFYRYNPEIRVQVQSCAAFRLIFKLFGGSLSEKKLRQLLRQPSSSDVA